MSTAVLLAPTIKVGGRELTAIASIVSLKIERGLGVVSRATLRLNDPGFALAAGSTFGIGTPLEVAVQGRSVFAGEVTGVSLEQHAGESVDFVVVADDLAYKLAIEAKPEAYLNRSYADAIKQLCKGTDLYVKVQTTALNANNDYLLRTGSRLEFLDRVTRRTGTVWWVEGKTMYVADAGTSSATVELALGTGLKDFSVRASGLRPTGARVSGWDLGSQQPIVGSATASSTTTAEFVKSYAGTGPSKIKAGDASTAGLFPSSQAEANTLAGALAEDAAAEAVVARGTCEVNAALAPGVTVEVSGAGPASGGYLVSEVEHSYTRRGFYTRFVAGPHRPAGLVDLLGRPATDPGLALAGLVVAQVSDNNDPDNHGRVKVKFMALDGSIDSTWARVVSVGAGPKRGFVVQPEVGDEVLVGFEFGDTRRPVVIGGLFSPPNDLPEATKVVADGKVDYRRITSRKNHVVEIADGDQPGDQHILLKLGTAEHSLLLGADKFELKVAQGKPVTIEAGSAKFAISDAGDVTIEGNNVTIKAKQQLDVEGGMGATLKSDGKTAVQGNMLSAQGQSQASVQGGSSLSLKGGTVQIN